MAKNTKVNFSLTSQSKAKDLEIGDYFIFGGSLRQVVCDTDNDYFYTIDPTTGRSASNSYGTLEQLRKSYSEGEISILKEVTITVGGQVV